jgi:NADPH:quinone reductase-like Zn-dependent oxidoreductase
MSSADRKAVNAIAPQFYAFVARSPHIWRREPLYEMRSLRLQTTEENQAAWRDLLKALARTGSRPLIEHVFPFEQLTQVFERLAGGPMGKVVVKVKPEG